MTAVPATGGSGRHPASRGWSRRGVVRQTLPAAALLVVAGIVLIGVGMRERDALVIGVGCLPVAAYLVSSVWGWRLGVRARLATPPRVVAGEPLTLMLRLQSDTGRGLPATTLSLSLPGNDDAAAPVAPGGPGAPGGPAPGGPGAPGSAPAHARPDARGGSQRRPGLLAVGPLAPDDEQWIVLQHVLLTRGPAGQARAIGVTTAPFGLVKHTWTVAVDTGLLVWPARRAPRPLPGGGLDGQARPAGLDRSGSDVQGVREYRPGDDRRHVHWRSSARRGSLVVTERERRLADDAIVLVLCPPRRARIDPLAAAAHAEWEELLARAAWTLAAAVERGSRVLLAAGGRGDPQATTMAGHGDVLDWFAHLPGACEPASARPWWSAGRRPDPAMQGGPGPAGAHPPWAPVPAPPGQPAQPGQWVQPAPTPQADPGGVPLPPDLAAAVDAVVNRTRRGEQVLLLATSTQPPQALHLAAGAVARLGRRPLAWGEWLR